MLRKCHVTRIVAEADVIMRRSGAASLGATYSPVIYFQMGDDEVWLRPRVLNAQPTVTLAFEYADRYCLEQLGAQVDGVPHVPPEDVSRQRNLNSRMRLERLARALPQYGDVIRSIGK